jgi:dihydrofolate reductase
MSFRRVEGNARLASGSLVEEIERLRAEPGDGDIAIGGATLAGEVAQLGLIDEFRLIVYPVLLGGGISSWSSLGPSALGPSTCAIAWRPTSRRRPQPTTWVSGWSAPAAV